MKSDIIDLFTKYNFETTAVMFDDDDGVAELLLIHSDYIETLAYWEADDGRNAYEFMDDDPLTIADDLPPHIARRLMFSHMFAGSAVTTHWDGFNKSRLQHPRMLQLPFERTMEQMLATEIEYLQGQLEDKE
jgi:hypothetical protein